MTHTTGSILVTALLVSGAGLTAQTKRSISVSSLDEIIPQFVYGGGWTTAVTLVNMSDEPVTVPIQFLTDAGQPWRIDVRDLAGGPFDSIRVTLAARGTFSFSTTDGGQQTQQGWARLDLPCCPDIGGFAVFRQRVTGRPDFEAVVPISSSFESRSILAFDNTGGFSTGVSLVNTDAFAVNATVTLTFRDENGQRIALDQITMPRNTKQVFSMPDRFPQTQGRRGTLEFTASPGRVAVLGLRFNPGGAFTSFHSFEP